MSGSHSTVELSIRSPNSSSMTPDDVNKAFDPFYSSPTPPANSQPQQNRAETPSNGNDFQALFSAAFSDQPTSVPPPVAERRSQTPKPPSPPISPQTVPTLPERTTSPTPKVNHPVSLPVRASQPPPPPARTRFLTADSQSNEKITLRRQPESASAVLASIPEVHISNANGSIPTTTGDNLNGPPSKHDEEVSEVNKMRSAHSQSTSALPTIRPRSHTPQTSSGTAFISPPHSGSGEDLSTIVSQSPITTGSVQMVSTEASSPAFALTPTRQTSLNSESVPAPSPSAAVSRGPSPFDGSLTFQPDCSAIPIGVSFSESIDAVCRGLESSQCCGLKVAGRLTVTFPAGFARAMADVARGNQSNKTLPHPLMFRVSPVRALHQVHHYRQLVAQIP